MRSHDLNRLLDKPGCKQQLSGNIFFDSTGRERRWDHPSRQHWWIKPSLQNTSEGQVFQSRISPNQAIIQYTPGMIKYHTMNKAKIAITVSPLVLSRLDAWVQSEHFTSRSEAIEKAVEAQLQRLERTRLSEQCALLDVAEEQAMADRSLAADAAAWPAF